MFISLIATVLSWIGVLMGINVTCKIQKGYCSQKKNKSRNYEKMIS